MRPIQILSLCVFLATILLVLSLSGCSFIGYQIGAASDARNADSVAVSAWRIDSLAPGTEVAVLLNDGTYFPKATIALESDSLNTYERRFAEFSRVSTVPISYPKPGDSVFVTVATGKSYSARLIAYDYGMIFIKPDTLLALHLRFPQLRSLEFDGKKIAGSELRDVVSRYSIPLQSMIAITDKATTQTALVSPSNIQSIQYRRGSSGWLTGLLVGAAVDVAVLAAVGSSASQSVRTTKKGSCPFVYSYDGANYVLDSETFSGAVFQSLERTDYDNLEHLVDVGGKCRLRLSNMLDETQYVDHLGLLIVDHPEAVEILPRPDGMFSTLQDLGRPSMATDLDGHVVTPLVSSVDALSWVSNPAGRCAHPDSSMRDGVVLAFERPSGTRHAKVVLRLSNTFWALEMVERLLRLQGTDLPRWYDAMNSDSDLRDAFVSVVEREAMLDVQLWDGESWKTIEYVPFVGPYVEKSHVTLVDLEGTPEGILRIRVESTAGMWIVDAIQVDFTADLPVQVKRAPLARATDHQGSSQVQPLSTRDGKYYVLRKGDEAEVEFLVPERKADAARTFVLESTGYYLIDVPAMGTPRHDVVRWIGNEPGAFGKYAASIYREWLESTLAVGERSR